MKQWFFVFEDTRERVLWIDQPSIPFGPWISEAEALADLKRRGWPTPDDVGYELVYAEPT